jgi:hypothetical protein
MKHFFLAIMLFTTGIVYAQSFEGTLTYLADLEVSESLSKMGVTKQRLIDKMKKEGTWSDTVKIVYKEGNYYTLVGKKPKSWTIYKAETNKIYTMQDGDASDICTVTDASIDLEATMTGKMPTVQKLDTSVVIDGVNCTIVRVKWKSGNYDYYYNATKLGVTPTVFAKHVYDGWAEFLKISNALPLKIVKTTKGMMSVTLTLVSSKTEKIDHKLFTIPTLISDETLNMTKLKNKEVMRIKK